MPIHYHEGKFPRQGASLRLIDYLKRHLWLTKCHIMSRKVVRGEYMICKRKGN